MVIDGRIQNQIARVWNGLSELANGDEGIIEAGEFRVDLQERTASVRGHELHLTPAEFQVLVFLTTHKKQLVSSRTNLSTRTLDGHITQSEFLPALLSLRKKLEQEVPNGHYLRTETWVLYDFQPGR